MYTKQHTSQAKHANLPQIKQHIASTYPVTIKEQVDFIHDELVSQPPSTAITLNTLLQASYKFKTIFYAQQTIAEKSGYHRRETANRKLGWLKSRNIIYINRRKKDNGRDLTAMYQGDRVLLTEYAKKKLGYLLPALYTIFSLCLLASRSKPEIDIVTPIKNIYSYTFNKTCIVKEKIPRIGSSPLPGSLDHESSIVKDPNKGEIHMNRLNDVLMTPLTTQQREMMEVYPSRVVKYAFEQALKHGKKMSFGYFMGIIKNSLTKIPESYDGSAVRLDKPMTAKKSRQEIQQEQDKIYAHVLRTAQARIKARNKGLQPGTEAYNQFVKQFMEN